ncbi:CBS domain-containing protein [Wenyingzhuangia sp. 2_MG-2023]|uniref:CBS domain-containing protein n=1 Tax=Wenyingzhuangia sp. 2_MG-2023 TaxID=3062639 RepID=UPI0026E371A6|nr:CBS domain-containing protein [Wenyingzhuangia sp. 2_MG-2023]MDO6736643.1 CBS domain-containing protein [Wenyingzhuangia sp. 2_MG-2023]MDO6801062.1 CBS domain-containing protein [Wenyingzhuangia sp. 1_MG-2023]
MAIKNYKAPNSNAIVLTDKIRVSDYMVPRNRLITFSEDLRVVEAMEILVSNNISGAPVVDENDHLLGMISEGDCMKKIANSRYYNIPLHDQVVKEYMESIVETIEGETNIFDVAHMFCTSRRNRFPVMSGNKVVGQISRKDILKAALEIK